MEENDLAYTISAEMIGNSTVSVPVPSEISFSPLNVTFPRVVPSFVYSDHVPPGMAYYVPGSDQYFIRTSNTINPWQAAPAREDKPMSQNKTYLVTDVNGDTEHVEAHDVKESGNRIQFLSYDNGATSVKKSLLGDLVASYEVVPAQEKPVTPKYVFQVNKTEGGPKKVAADKVLRSSGENGATGRYSFVTEISPGTQRTEYVVPEDKVSDIERVTEDGAKAVKSKS